jgi:hypothetical protein
MPFAFTQDVPIDAATYGRIRDGIGDEPPPGLIVHSRSNARKAACGMSACGNPRRTATASARSDSTRSCTPCSATSSATTSHPSRSEPNVGHPRMGPGSHAQPVNSLGPLEVLPTAYAELGVDMLGCS